MARIRDKIKKFFEPEPDKVRVRDVVREVPRATFDVLKEIPQGIARGGVALSKFGAERVKRGQEVKLPVGPVTKTLIGTASDIIRKGPEKTFSAEVEFKDPRVKKLLGREKTSLQAEGEEVTQLLKFLGASDQTVKSAAGPVGFLLAASDFVPGGSSIKRAAKSLAKTADEVAISQILKTSGVKQADITPNLVKAIAKEQDEKTVQSLLESQLASRPKRVQMEQLEEATKAVRELEDVKIKAQNALKSDIAFDEATFLKQKEAVKLADEALKQAKANPIFDKAKQLDQYMQGLRAGQNVGKRQVAEIQDFAIEKINRLPVENRGKYLKALKNTKNQKTLLDTIERVDADYAKVLAIKEARAKVSDLQTTAQYIKTAGDFSPKLIKDVKKFIGLEKPINEYSEGSWLITLKSLIVVWVLRSLKYSLTQHE